MSYSWFRMYGEAVDDEKLRLLAFEDRWHFVALMCCKSQGLLDACDDPSLRHRKIAVKLGLQVRELDEVARRLSEVGLIDADTLQPLAWDRRQYVSDHSSDRVAKHRDRKKQACDQAVNGENGVKQPCNVTVTPPDTDTDTDTDISNATHYSSKLSSELRPDAVAAEDEQQKKPPLKNGVPYGKIVDLYHEMLPHLPRTMQLTPARRAQIAARWRDELPELDDWRYLFGLVSRSDFLSGRATPSNGRTKPFRADLEWISKQANTVKIAEGKYENGKN